MSRRLCPLGVLLVVALLGPADSAHAQAATSRLVIDARESTGRTLSGVVVTVTSQDTGIERRAETQANGLAAVTALPAGTYTVRAGRDGFKTEIVRDVRLKSGVHGTIVFTLVPGRFTEHVVVTADAATVRIGNSAVGRVFESESMLALPVNGREPLELAQLSAGVSPPAPGSRLSTQGNSGINSAGAREAANNFLLDGVDNNDLFIGRLVAMPSLDAIQELSILQNTYDAEHGRSAGAQVNMVLKSGTRELRGSAYEFFRGSALDAPSPLQPSGEPKAPLERHLFGGSLGGSAGRHSSFFFLSVEGTRAREGETRLAHVPTLAERRGDFSRSGITLVDPFTGQPFSDNTIPDERISHAARAIVNLYPVPNRDDPVANFASSPVGRRDAGQATIKTDHHLGPENLLSVRYTFSRDARALPFVARNRNLPGFGLSSLDQGQNLAIGFTQAVSPRLLHVVRLGVNGSRRDNLPGLLGVDGFSALGLSGPSLGKDDIGYPAIELTGYEPLGDDPNLPVVRRTRTVHLSSHLTIEGSRHRLRTGGELRTYRSDGYNHLFGRGSVTFAGVFTGSSLGDLLLGFPTFSLLAENDNRQALRTWALSGFIQDDWRVSSSVTINAGLRYEYNSPPTDADDRMRIFDLERRRLVQVATNGVPRSGLNGDFNNFAPRVGVSWDLSGHGTLVVRGGYGLFYDAGTLIENSALYFNPPYFSLRLFFPTADRLLRIEAPFPAGGGFSPAPSVNTLDPHFRTAYAQQGSLSIERVFREMTVTGRYVTAHGRHLVRKRNINQPVPGPGELDARRPIPDFGDVLLVESKAASSYHALQVDVDRQLFRRLAFHGAYTWSTSMDDASAFLASDGNDNMPQNSQDPAAEWGPSDFHVRHRLVLSGTYQIPALGSSPLSRHWELGVVFAAQSGRPFTPRLTFDNSNTGNIGGATFGSDRPNVLDGPAAPGQTTFPYGRHAFVIPPPFTFGDAGRNMLTGPPYISFDLLLSRRLAFGASRALELRLEIFNLFNRRNDQLPDSFVDRATFGQSLATYAPRQVQLAARLVF